MDSAPPTAGPDRDAVARLAATLLGRGAPPAAVRVRLIDMDLSEAEASAAADQRSACPDRSKSGSRSGPWAASRSPDLPGVGAPAHR